MIYCNLKSLKELKYVEAKKSVVLACTNITSISSSIILSFSKINLTTAE